MSLTSAFLIYRPTLWMFNSWLTQPSHFVTLAYLVALVSLVFWSLSSPERFQQPVKQDIIYLMLFVSAAMRFTGQVLGIHDLASLTFCIDVFALAILYGLKNRTCPVSPYWLSMIFLLSIPGVRSFLVLLINLFQEVINYHYCQLISFVFEGITCIARDELTTGFELLYLGKDLVFGIPYNGDAVLMISMLALFIMNAIYRPNWLISFTSTAAIVCLYFLATLVCFSLFALSQLGLENLISATLRSAYLSVYLNAIINFVAFSLSVLPILAYYAKFVAPRPNPASKHS